jgi:microcystin-dependent protein
MSFPEWNSDPSWNKITSSYFRDNIDLSGNFIIRNGTIRSPANEIQFDDTFGFVNFVNSVNVFSQLKNTYNSVVYDVGLQCEKTDTLVADVATLSPIVSDTQFKTTGFYWDSGLSTTVFNNNASFPNGSISSTAINNTSFVALSGEQTIDGVKSFNSAPVMSGASITTGTIPVNRVSGSAVNLSTTQTITATKTFSVAQTFQNNIRLDGSLLVNNGANTITNAQLQNIADIGTLKTITTAISYTPATTTTLITGVLQWSGTLNGWNTTNFYNAINYSKSATSDLQAQITTLSNNSVSLSASNVFTGATNQFSNTLRLDGDLILNANTLTLTNANLQKIQYLSTVSSDIQTQINGINGVSLSASNIFTALNRFSNNIRLDGSLIVNNNTTTLTNDNLNRIQHLSGVSSSVSTSISNLNTSVSTLNTKTTKMSYESVLGLNTTTITDSLVSQVFTFSTSINNISTTTFGYLSNATENLQGAINSLKTKTTDLSYSASTTTIANTLATSTLTFSSTLNNISTTTFGYLSGLTENIKTSLDNLSARIATVEIVGTIIMSPLNDLQTTTSNKYLACNGLAVSRTTYSALFAKFGELFGVGNGTTTFNLPNYNGMFLRGMGNQIINNVNYGNYNSTYQPDPDSIQNHTHSGQAGAYLGTNNTLQSVGYMATMNYAPASYSFANTGNMSSGRINDFETKPVSIGIYYYVRT